MRLKHEDYVSTIDVESSAVEAKAVAINTVAAKSNGADRARTERGRPLIGLVLGSGAARGFAHIGVIYSLKANGLVSGIIVRTLIRALVGGCYATGPPDPLEEWARSLTRRRIIGYLDVRIGGSGLVGGGRLAARLQESVGKTLIEDLPVRFAAIATEIGTGHEVWLARGILALALRASYALPGIFPPVCVGGRWLVGRARVRRPGRHRGQSQRRSLRPRRHNRKPWLRRERRGADCTRREVAQRAAAHVRRRACAQASNHCRHGTAGLLDGHDRVVQHHAGSPHPRAACRRSARHPYHAAAGPYQPSRFPSRGGNHRGRPGRHRKGARPNYGIDCRAELRRAAPITAKAMLWHRWSDTSAVSSCNSSRTTCSRSDWDLGSGPA